jgi:hypothetical protein
MVYLICDCDLSFEMMEKQSFLDLLKICNPQTDHLQVKNDAISQHLAEVFLFHQELLQEHVLAKSTGVSYTLDAWTAPNTTAFMSITAHMIKENFEKIDVLLRVPHIEGDVFLCKFLNLEGSLADLPVL